MNVQFSCFGADDFRETQIGGQIEFPDFINKFAFEFYGIAFVSDGGFPFFVFFGSSSFGLDVFMALTIIDFFGLFFKFLIDSIELELADHDDGVGVFKFL